MSGLAEFLASVPIFRELPLEQLREIEPLFRTERVPAGTVILHQGRSSQAVYFLRSGQLAVRVQRLEGRETIAFLQPGAVFGELSFITGRTCSADVEVVVDAEVVWLPKEAVPNLPRQRDAILRGMMTVLAERLHDTVTRGSRPVESPVVLLENRPDWPAPRAFAEALAKSLGRQTSRDTLVVNVGDTRTSEPMAVGDRVASTNLAFDGRDGGVRALVAERLPAWKGRFSNVVLNPLPPDSAAVCEQVAAFSDCRGYLLGGGDQRPTDRGAKHFVVQTGERSTLPFLSGNSQLVWQAQEAEECRDAGRALPSRFLRTTDSIARFIADVQVGIALGGGAAWGWAHVGVLSVLEEAGLPIDVVAGCSMGSVVGTLRCSGRSIAELREIAGYWRSRTRRFVEYRVWRMHLIKEKMVRKVFGSYFGDRCVNQTEIPFWANAVDIRNGKEYTVTDGSLVDAVRASIALPGLLPPAEREGHVLVDAGIMDPVPVGLIRRMGCRYAIAVNAMAPLESQEVSRRYPLNMFDMMFRCTRIMGHEIGQARAESLANVTMIPPYRDISMLQFDRDEEIIECGRQVARENLPAILAGYERLKTFETKSSSTIEGVRL
jgi:NTE family protein